MLTPAKPTYIAAEAIPGGARVKFVAGSRMRIELADAGDAEIGTAIYYDGATSYAAESPVTVNLVSNPGGRSFLASGAILVSDTLFRADNGRVSASGSGAAIGLPLEAGADGDVIDGLILPAVGTENASASDGLSAVRVARATFDPSAIAGHRTIGAKTLGVTLPINAIITRMWWDVVTTFTSATDAATIAFHAEGAGDLQPALAISDARNIWDAGRRFGLPGLPNLGADTAHDSQAEVAALFAATFVKTTAARLITATVAVEPLTAGKAILFVEYVIGG